MFFERPYRENPKSKSRSPYEILEKLRNLLRSRPRSPYEILEELRNLLRSRPRSPYEILEELRKSQGIYFSDAKKEGIEQNQRKPIERLKEQAREILGKAEDRNTPEEDRDRLMAEYGLIMDQTAINLPWSEMSEGNMRDIQNEALEKLQEYLEQHPQAKEVARSIFMLFHHGAGIDKNLTADAYQQMLQNQLPSEKFACEYVDAEEKAKLFLERYIAATLGIEKFSLDDNDDYQELIRLIDQEQLSQEQRTCIIDAANWYRRISYYQKVANLDKNRETYLGRAIELHAKLAEVDPSFNEFLDAIYQEQGIEKPEKFTK